MRDEDTAASAVEVSNRLRWFDRWMDGLIHSFLQLTTLMSNYSILTIGNRVIPIGSSIILRVCTIHVALQIRLDEDSALYVDHDWCIYDIGLAILESSFW